jgi:signal transduction histidine kinase
MADSARHLGHIELILHELRTPVNVAAGSLAQLLEPDSDALSAAQQSAIVRAIRACSQMEQLCEDLRDWAHVSGGEPMVTTTLLAPALKEAAKAAEATRRDTVHLLLPDDQRQDWRVRSPSGLLVRALTGILAACLRTAPDRASIPVVVDDDPGLRELRILVGEISPTPGDSFEAERMGGLGFALPLARAVIEAAGGRVWSAAGAGRGVGIGIGLSLPRSG